LKAKLPQLLTLSIREIIYLSDSLHVLGVPIGEPPIELKDFALRISKALGIPFEQHIENQKQGLKSEDIDMTAAIDLELCTEAEIWWVRDIAKSSISMGKENLGRSILSKITILINTAFDSSTPLPGYIVDAFMEDDDDNDTNNGSDDSSNNSPGGDPKI